MHVNTEAVTQCRNVMHIQSAFVQIGFLRCFWILAGLGDYEAGHGVDAVPLLYALELVRAAPCALIFPRFDFPHSFSVRMLYTTFKRLQS